MAATLALWLLMQAAAPANQAALAEAAQAIEAGRYDQAAVLLEKVVARDPADYRARFNLAFAYAELERGPEAIEQYLKVVELEPDLAVARLNLGILLVRQKKPAEAAPHLEAAAEKRPEDARVRVYLGDALLETGQAQRAVGAYRRAVELDPKSGLAALGLGRALARAGDRKAARDHLLRAASLDAELRDGLLELADSMESNREPGEAIALYLEYLKGKPDAVAVRERAGFLLLDQKRYPEAIEQLEAAVKMGPTAANQAALAQGYTLAGEPAKALPWLRAAAASDPGRPELRLRLATTLLEQGSHAEAARELQAALAKKPEDREAWSLLAFALYRLENPAGALEALNRARAWTSPGAEEPPGNHYLRGILHDRSQQYAEALDSYQQFLAAAKGRYPDDEFKARQRVRILTNILNKRR